MIVSVGFNRSYFNILHVAVSHQKTIEHDIGTLNNRFGRRRGVWLHLQ